MDLSFAPAGAVYNRLPAQDFSLPFYFEYSTLAYKKVVKANKMDVYAMPFKLTVRIIVWISHLRDTFSNLTRSQTI